MNTIHLMLLYQIKILQLKQFPFQLFQRLFQRHLKQVLLLSDLNSILLDLPDQVLAVGLAEEGLFRGYIQTKVSAILGPWGGILVQAVLFGLWHVPRWLVPLNLGGMAFHVASSFLFAFVLGVYYRHTRSIVAPALLHGLTNAVSRGATLDLLGRLGGGGIGALALGIAAAAVPLVLVVLFAGPICHAFGAASPAALGRAVDPTGPAPARAAVRGRAAR